ncbi:hypothetical protein K505DRAFT_95682 [Melanomma pulvis-pyrius CBS 109.77]|uniref:Uncharacterized protein n=1 Tax=Melanomma pulvis-pyrius CBS 109.77 TaxID=1314802 RepID=A0A6A6WYZ7_9PLEO|nr:hypothetical protein K505DRAFT_95682 [Melanomma pulvis-pyrius CBS 109.77]
MKKMSLTLPSQVQRALFNAVILLLFNFKLLGFHEVLPYSCRAILRIVDAVNRNVSENPLLSRDMQDFTQIRISEIKDIVVKFFFRAFEFCLTG